MSETGVPVNDAAGPVIPGLDGLVLVASSASSRVFRAVQVGLGREVAVKVLRQGISDTADTAFSRECAVAALLSEHPNVATIHSSGRTNEGLPYLVMEWYGGSSLADVLARRGPFSWEQATRCVVEIGGAVESFHQHGAVHGDLKPANILFDQRERPVLIDFGSAVLNDEARSGPHPVTPEHASPEFLIDGPTVSGDLYSLASTYFELLSGVAPFGDRESDTAEPMSAGVAPRRLLSEIAPQVPVSLAGLCEANLSESPPQRCGSVAEFIHALREASIEEGFCAPEAEVLEPLASVVGSLSVAMPTLPPLEQALPYGHSSNGATASGELRAISRGRALVAGTAVALVAAGLFGLSKVDDGTQEGQNTARAISGQNSVPENSASQNAAGQDAAGQGSSTPQAGEPGQTTTGTAISGSEIDRLNRLPPGPIGVRALPQGGVDQTRSLIARMERIPESLALATEPVVLERPKSAFSGSAPFELDMKYFNNATPPDCTWFVAQGLQVSGAAQGSFGLELGVLTLQLVAFGSELEAEAHITGSSLNADANDEECSLPSEIWSRAAEQPVVNANHLDVQMEGVDHFNTFLVRTQGSLETYALLFRDDLEVGLVVLNAGADGNQQAIVELLQRAASVLRR